MVLIAVEAEREEGAPELCGAPSSLSGYITAYTLSSAHFKHAPFGL
jgi:hypothetical protein